MIERFWDYGTDENGEGVEGAPLEVEIVDCEYNRKVQAQLDKPTNLTEIGF